MAYLQLGLRREPPPDAYEQILRVALHHCTQVLLVVQPHNELKERGLRTLATLRPYLISKEHAQDWPGTRLLRGGADVYRFRFCDEVIGVLLDATRHLFEWCQPDLPEDLALLTEDGRPWLLTVAHERDGVLTLSEQEHQDLGRAIPELAVLLLRRGESADA